MSTKRTFCMYRFTLPFYSSNQNKVTFFFSVYITRKKKINVSENIVLRSASIVNRYGNLYTRYRHIYWVLTFLPTTGFFPIMSQYFCSNGIIRSHYVLSLLFYIAFSFSSNVYFITIITQDETVTERKSTSAQLYVYLVGVSFLIGYTTILAIRSALLFTWWIKKLFKGIIRIY